MPVGPSRAGEPEVASAPFPLLLTPAGFALLLSAYALGHLALRVSLASAVTIDDARESVFAQTLAWGYQPRQPPLYNWLVWGAFRILGPGVLALHVVKYAVLAVAYAALYATARRALRDPRLPVPAACGLLLLLPVAWIVHEALTHSVAVLAACAVTVHSLVRLESSGRARDYLALGAALGLGLLSKFSYAVFAVALLVAALSLAPFRARLGSPRVLLSLGAAVVLCLPFALWYRDQGFGFLGMASTEVRAGEGDDVLEGALDGLFYVAKVTLIYAGPLLAVCLAVLPQVCRRPFRLPDGARPGALLAERFLLSVLALLVLGALLTLLTFLKYRWLIPGFFLLPLLAFARLDAAGLRPGQLRRLAVALLLVEAAVVGGYVLRVWAGDLGGRPDKLNEPYDRLAARLREAGFRGGTIVAGRGPLGGNLRLEFPASRVLSLESPYYVPPEAAAGGQCLVAWEKGDPARVPGDLREFLARALDAPLDEGATPAVADARFHHTRDRVRRIGYLLLPATGRCR